MTAAHIAFLECALDENDDDAKNDRCYFMRGTTAHNVNKAENILGIFYHQNQTIEKLMTVPGGQKFVFGSRTNLFHPKHHRGGLLRMLWYALGPERGLRKALKSMKKIGSKKFAGVDHVFGADTIGTVEI